MFTHTPKNWKGVERRGKWWKEAERYERKAAEDSNYSSVNKLHNEISFDRDLYTSSKLKLRFYEIVSYLLVINQLWDTLCNILLGIRFGD